MNKILRPMEYSLSIIKNKWVIFILRELFDNKKIGFNALLKNIKSISKKVLLTNLNFLITKNIITKEIIKNNNTVRTFYELTNIGKNLFLIINSLKEYGIKYNK